MPEILSLTHVNPILKDRRWFAVGAAQYENDITAGFRGRRMASKVSLTTLTYLGNEDASQQPIESRNFLSGAFESTDVKGTVYEE